MASAPENSANAILTKYSNTIFSNTKYSNAKYSNAKYNNFMELCPFFCYTVNNDKEVF